VPQPVFAAHDRPDALEENLRRRVFQNDTGNAQLHGGNDFVAIQSIRQNDGSRCVWVLRQLRKSLDWRPLRLRESEQQDVWRQLADKRNGRPTISNLPKDAQAWFGFEQAPETMPENGVLAGNDQSDELGVFRHDYQVAARSRMRRTSADGCFVGCVATDSIKFRTRGGG